MNKGGLKANIRKVLSRWENEGRVGLSCQALSEICGEPVPPKLMFRSRTVVFLFCGQLRAPLLCLRATEFFNTERNFRLRKEAELLWEKYPWPKYKGLKDMRGLKTTGLDARELKILRSVLE